MACARRNDNGKCLHKAQVERMACAKRSGRGHDGDTMMTSANIRHELGEWHVPNAQDGVTMEIL